MYEKYYSQLRIRPWVESNKTKKSTDVRVKLTPTSSLYDQELDVTRFSHLQLTNQFFFLVLVK